MRRIAVMLLVLLLSGCAAPPAASTSAAAANSASPAAPRVESMRASLVESSPRPLLEADVLEAYDRAQRVYGWFDLAPLPASDEPLLIDGALYYRVTMNGVDDLEDLRAYLRSVFSQELTDRLLDGETARIQYREVDDVLYVSGNGRERDASVGASRVELEQLDEVTCYVNVLVDLLDEDGVTVVGLESWSFPCAFQEERWVFTDFQLIY